MTESHSRVEVIDNIIIVHYIGFHNIYDFFDITREVYNSIVSLNRNFYFISNGEHFEGATPETYVKQRLLIETIDSHPKLIKRIIIRSPIAEKQSKEIKTNMIKAHDEENIQEAINYCKNHKLSLLHH